LNNKGKTKVLKIDEIKNIAVFSAGTMGPGIVLSLLLE